ncbi:uncharacterized protein LOC105384017 [Plutella xylostella]|uniref:uncharacterized protein LOC105384017 n=1 Tax=Plutella xylostella TaxID=51655 RepID=UPI0005D04ED7|nr:uncharacterized protein LOC105384017 [Plutella xylostella]
MGSVSSFFEFIKATFRATESVFKCVAFTITVTALAVVILALSVTSIGLGYHYCSADFYLSQIKDYQLIIDGSGYTFAWTWDYDYMKYFWYYNDHYRSQWTSKTYEPFPGTISVTEFWYHNRYTREMVERRFLKRLLGVRKNGSPRRIEDHFADHNVPLDHLVPLLKLESALHNLTSSAAPARPHTIHLDWKEIVGKLYRAVAKNRSNDYYKDGWSPDDEDVT